jgi:hypothetical protein
VACRDRLADHSGGTAPDYADVETVGDAYRPRGAQTLGLGGVIDAGDLGTTAAAVPADDEAGRPWRLPMEDRVLLVATYWRTNLTLRQVAPLFGVSKSAADRILDHPAPPLAISPGR